MVLTVPAQHYFLHKLDKMRPSDKANITVHFNIMNIWLICWMDTNTTTTFFPKLKITFLIIMKTPLDTQFDLEDT